MPTPELDSIRGSESANGPKERRYARYVSFQGDVVRLAVRPAFGGRMAVLLNVSAGGLGFLLDMPLKVGDILALEMSSAAEEGSTVRVARVCHCRPHPVPADAPWLKRPSVLGRLARWFRPLPATQSEGGAWMIGCAFNQPLDAAELEQMLVRLRRLSREKRRPVH
jgi:hypothetical protein